MANISLSVLASDVNDLNGGALTANFSHLLRDPVQITLNRPLVSNWLRAWDFQRYRHQLRTPGPVKISMNYPLVGLRLTSTDRTIYRRYLIDRKSHSVSTSFQLYCHLRSTLLVVREYTRLIESLQKSWTRRRYQQRCYWTALPMRHVATAFSRITSKVVARVPFDFTLGRTEPIIVSLRDSKCAQIEKFTDDWKSLVSQVPSLFPCFFRGYIK